MIILCVLKYFPNKGARIRLEFIIFTKGKDNYSKINLYIRKKTSVWYIIHLDAPVE